VTLRHRQARTPRCAVPPQRRAVARSPASPPRYRCRPHVPRLRPAASRVVCPVPQPTSSTRSCTPTSAAARRWTLCRSSSAS
jgi:hypothetical protein